MITSVRGTCLAVSTETAVIEVGGIGLVLSCTPAALARLQVGQEGRLDTALVVREDAWTLYGFDDLTERVLFERLQSVTGVGPRMAVGAVGTLGAGELVRAIGAGDLLTLTAIPGVGRKTAERMVLELREKVSDLVVAESSGVGAQTTVPATAALWQRQVADGLVGLGWQSRDAESAVRAVAAELSDEDAAKLTVSALLRRALTKLDRV